jgi:hypothetical protein
MDVPSPIDLCRPDEAEAWAEAANVKRPWRADFFDAIVAELRGRGVIAQFGQSASATRYPELWRLSPPTSKMKGSGCE